MEIVKGFARNNIIQIILYSIIFFISFVFTDISIYMGYQLKSFAGILLIGATILYLFIILSTILKLQVTMDRNIWKNLFRFGLLCKEKYKITAGFDFLLVVASFPISKIVSNYVMGYLMKQHNGFGIILLICASIEIVLLGIAFLKQNFFLTNVCEREQRVQSYKIYENAPLFLKNVLRNKEKMRVVVEIICTGVVVCNGILFLLNCDKSEVYLDKAISVDYFLTGHSTGSDKLRTPEEIVKERDIEKVEKKEYFQDGGKIYHSLDTNRVSLITNALPETSQFPLFYQFEFEKNGQGNYLVNLYGADNFVFSNMELYEGAIDYEKLASGKYIIYGLERKPGNIAYTGEVCDNWKYFNVGDQIELVGESRGKKYEIMATCIVNHTYAEDHSYSYPGKELVFYLPTKEYLSFGNDNVMRYLFNTKNSEVVDEQLSGIKFESRHGWCEQYMRDRETIKNSAVFFAFGCVGIGFFVYMNILIVSYIDRRKEFLILGNIGMTHRQIRQMVLGEGITYGIFIAVICIVISIFIELLGKLVLVGESWEFRVTVRPLLFSIIVVLAVSVVVPLLVYRHMNKTEMC